MTLVGGVRVLAAIILALASATSAIAQVSTFDLSGAVLDPSGGVTPGVTVSLKNTQTGLARTDLTDQGGRYHFIALPVVGVYTLRVELQGFSTVERPGLRLQATSQ